MIQTGKKNAAAFLPDVVISGGEPCSSKDLRVIFRMLPPAFNVGWILFLYYTFSAMEEILSDHVFSLLRDAGPDSEWCHQLSSNSGANEVN